MLDSKFKYLYILLIALVGFFGIIFLSKLHHAFNLLIVLLGVFIYILLSLAGEYDYKKEREKENK